MRVCTPSMRGDGVIVCSTDLLQGRFVHPQREGRGSLSVVQTFTKRVCTPSKRGGHCLRCRPLQGGSVHPQREGVIVCSTYFYNEGLFTLNERGGGHSL